MSVKIFLAQEAIEVLKSLMSFPPDGKNLNFFIVSTHNRIYSLLDHLHQLHTDNSVSPAVSLEEFERICRSHLYWEEEFVFPLFNEKAPAASGVVEQLKTEHNRIKNQLIRITGSTEPTASSMSNVTENLRMLLGLHFYKEEMFLVPKMEEMCSEREKEELYQNFKSVYEGDKSSGGSS